VTPLTAGAAAGVMIPAVAAVHCDKGFFPQDGGCEYPLALAAAAIAVAFAEASKYHRLHRLKGWGPHTEQNLRRAIAQVQASGGRIQLNVALDLAESVLSVLGAVPGVRDLCYAGSVRRMRETVGDIDILVTADDDRPLLDTFGSMPLTDTVLAKGHATLPNQAERRAILAVHARDKRLAPDVDLDRVARATPGFSGADLANLVNEAAINAVREDRDIVTAADFDAARDRILLGRRDATNALLPDEKYDVAVHESGHTLVAVYSDHADPVDKVTILPAGMALGLTEQLPENERHLYQESYLYDLRRLRRKGIIASIPHSHRYQLTPHGRRVAVLFTKTYGRVLAPGLVQLDLRLPAHVA
jgi:hypothetical protein